MLNDSWRDLFDQKDRHWTKVQRPALNIEKTKRMRQEHFEEYQIAFTNYLPGGLVYTKTISIAGPRVNRKMRNQAKKSYHE